MATALTFGAELEFILSLVKDPEYIPNDPFYTSRIVYIPTPPDSSPPSPPSSLDERSTQTKEQSISEDDRNHPSSDQEEEDEPEESFFETQEESIPEDNNDLSPSKQADETSSSDGHEHKPVRTYNYMDASGFKATQRCIAQILHTAGFPVNLQKPWTFNTSLSTWIISDDYSIHAPTLTPLTPKQQANYWKTYAMEIKSPAFHYSEDALLHIRKFCRVVTQNFCVNVNKTTGLHVHIGLGKTEEFSFPPLRNLHAFFWTFEPQLKTIHPENRQIEWFAQNMRSSLFTYQFREEEKRNPDVAEGVRYFLLEECNDSCDVIDAGQAGMRCRYMAYNFEEIHKLLGDHDGVLGAFGAKNTVEFRQHKGTFDEERVVNWIRVVAGIVQFCRKAVLDPVHMARLLEVANLESVVDVEAEREIAEERFTVVDLLKWLDLGRAAEFYRRRLEKLVVSAEEDDDESLPSDVATKWTWSSSGSPHSVPGPEFDYQDFELIV